MDGTNGTAHVNILWASTVGTNRSAFQYIDAAASSRAGSVSLHAERLLLREPDVRAHDAEQAYAKSRDIMISVLDGIYCWLPLEHTTMPEVTLPLDKALQLAEVLGVTSLNVVGRFVRADIPDELVAQSFSDVCDRANNIGCRVHLEFIPYGGISDLARAWDIVRLADRPNGGIQFDTWHFFRGSGDLELLASIPGRMITGVQISDADVETRGSLAEETLHHRKLPEQGSFDLESVIRILYNTGGLSLVGPEVLSDELSALPPNEAARIAVGSVNRILDKFSPSKTTELLT
jgi:sugar phosphate isomerase/epimerase